MDVTKSYIYTGNNAHYNFTWMPASCLHKNIINFILVPLITVATYAANFAHCNVVHCMLLMLGMYVI